MTKPTGRPRGRPKTKEYVTVMTRMDTALADRLTRYARLHRHTISDALREGVFLLLQEEDPWHPILSDAHTAPDNLSGAHTGTEKASDIHAGAENVSDVKRGVEHLSDTKAGEVIVYDTKRDKDMLSDTKEDTAIVSDTRRDVPEPVVPETVATSYDPDVAYARMQALQAQGQSFRQIAAQLTAEGIPTHRGGPWGQSSVRYVLKTHGQ